MGLQTIHSQKPHKPASGTAANRQALLKRASQHGSIFGGGAASGCNNNFDCGNSSLFSSKDTKGAVGLAVFGTLAGAAGAIAITALQCKSSSNEAKASSGNDSGKTSDKGSVNGAQANETADAALKSTDAQQVKSALNSTKSACTNLTKQISDTEKSAQEAGKAADDALKNAEAMQDTLAQDEQAVKDAEDLPNKEGGSATLPAKCQEETDKVPKEITQTVYDNTGAHQETIKNPSYDSQVSAIKAKYDKLIKAAQEKESKALDEAKKKQTTDKAKYDGYMDKYSAKNDEQNRLQAQAADMKEQLSTLSPKVDQLQGRYDALKDSSSKKA